MNDFYNEISSIEAETISVIFTALSSILTTNSHFEGRKKAEYLGLGLCQNIWSVWSCQKLICAKEESHLVKKGSQGIKNSRNTI